MKQILLALAIAFMATTATAQIKLGHANVQEILMVLPERAVAEKEVQDLAKKLETRLQTMSGEYQKKVESFTNERESLSRAEQESQYNEIMDLQKRIEEFRQTAQVEIQNKENALLQPMIEKIERAIESVGKSNGFTYIFDTSTGAVLFEGGEDVSGLIKTSMGI
jgi:outer membrane protein